MQAGLRITSQTLNAEDMFSRVEAQMGKRKKNSPEIIYIDLKMETAVEEDRKKACDKDSTIVSYQKVRKKAKIRNRHNDPGHHIGK